MIKVLHKFGTKRKELAYNRSKYIYNKRIKKHKKHWINYLNNAHPLFQIVFKSVHFQGGGGVSCFISMILTKKEYLKAFTFADFMHILNKLLDLVLLLQNSK